MITRRLGRTNLEVFPLGLGGHTYPIGTEPGAFATPEQRAALVAMLVAGGVNYFDTTWLNEVQDLADAFRRAGVGRQALVSLQYVDGLSDGQWRQKLRPEIEQRLAVMGYTSAPLFLMGVGNGKPTFSDLVAACEALHALKAEGVVRNIGLSCHQLEYFPQLARLIAQTDLLDYLLIRFNWKYPQAAAELFPVVAAHDVGLVAMKVFCWDCGPDQWGRRISVFEPLSEADRAGRPAKRSAAQRSLIWTLQQPPIAVAVPAMNTVWEAQQNLLALDALGAEIDTSDFPRYAERLWSADALAQLAALAESDVIRERASALGASSSG